LILSNLHSHTTYSDGLNTPLQMIEKAIELNFESIGFSEHAQCGFDIDCKEIEKKDQKAYFNLLESYKEKYPEINIFKGLELDSLNPTHEGNLDYSIGSIHFLKIKGQIIPIDFDAEKLISAIELVGGKKLFVIKYYEEVLNFAKTCNFDIMGHLDIYTKFNEQIKIFNTSEKWYLDIVTNTIEELNKLDKIIEINTGAIAKGYRTTPYPDLPIFKILKDLNSKIIVGSDTHSINHLNCKFDYVEQLLKENNISKIYTLTKEGFKEKSL